VKFAAGLPIIAMSDPLAIRDFAQALDGAEFDVISTAGHVLAAPPGRFPDRPTPTYAGPFHDPFVLFGYLAAITQRLHFRTGILILPLLPTALVAKQAAELQQLKGIGPFYSALIVIRGTGFADVLPAISNKALDTSWMIEPLTTAGIDRGIIGRFKTATELFGPQQNTMIFYSPAFSTQRTETGKKFMAAYVKGLRDYLDAMDKNKHYDAVVGILTKESSLKDPALFKKLGLPGFDPNAGLLLDAVKTNLKWFVDHGDVKTAPDVEKIYDPRYLDYAMTVDGKR